VPPYPPEPIPVTYSISIHIVASLSSCMTIIFLGTSTSSLAKNQPYRNGAGFSDWNIKWIAHVLAVVEAIITIALFQVLVICCITYT
jgi:hypothetical protein